MKASLNSGYMIDVSMNLPKLFAATPPVRSSSRWPTRLRELLKTREASWSVTWPRTCGTHQLWERVSRGWERLRQRPGYLANLAASMPRRLREVVAAEDGYTKH